MAKKYLTLFSTIILFCMNIQAQNNWQDELLEKWKNATAYTLETAELMPEEHYSFQPTDEQRTFQDQLLHTASNMIWISSSFLGHTEEGFDLSKKKEEWKNKSYTKTETIAELTWALNFAAKAIENFDMAKADEIVDFFAGPKTKRQMLMLLNDHHTHHRGQMMVYLRLNDIKPPRYRGW